MNAIYGIAFAAISLTLVAVATPSLATVIGSSPLRRVTGGFVAYLPVILPGLVAEPPLWSAACQHLASSCA